MEKKKYISVILVAFLLVGLLGCAQSTANRNDGETETKWARLPMVMIDGVLYYDTGRLSTVSARCGNMDGEITSAVDCSEIPTENNQSNFGTGYGYQIGPMEGTIEVCTDGGWSVFATKEVREQIQFPEGGAAESEENSHLSAGE